MSLKVKINGAVSGNVSATVSNPVQQSTSVPIEADPAGTVVTVASGIIGSNLSIGSQYYTKDEIDEKHFLDESTAKEVVVGQVDNELIVPNDENKITVNKMYRSGYLIVENILRRNLINKEEIEVGTRCLVKNENKFYKLILASSGNKAWTDDEAATFDQYATNEKRGTVVIGDNLKTDTNGKLVVDVATEEEKGSIKPISAGAVYDILGNIKIRLEHI